MGWIRRGGGKGHDCVVPEPEPDAIWACDDCGARWHTESSMTTYDPRTKKRIDMGWWWVKGG